MDTDDLNADVWIVSWWSPNSLWTEIALARHPQKKTKQKKKSITKIFFEVELKVYCNIM